MTENKSELNEKGLDKADGGLYITPEMPQHSKTIYNAKRDVVGTQNLVDNSISYYPCSRCRKPMHTGWFGWYCDPCNNHEFNAAEEVWSGSVDALKAASL